MNLGRILSSVVRPRIALGLFSFLLVLASWAIASPVGSGPDDNFHLASAYCGQGLRSGLCEPGSTPLERRVPNGLLSAHKCYFEIEASASCLTEDRVLENPVLGYFTPNTRRLYPPVFYYFSSYFASSNLVGSVLGMRVFNLFVVFAMLTLTYRHASHSQKGGLAITWCVLLIPLGFFTISSNNPTSWAIAGTGTFLVNLITLLESNSTKQTISSALLVALSFALACGSRGDSGYFLLVGLAIGALLSWTSMKPIARQYFLICCIPFTLLTFWFTARASQSTVIFDGLTGTSAKRSSTGLIQNNLENIVSLLFGQFGYNGNTRLGNLGWFNTPIPPTASLIATSLFVTLCIIMFTYLDKLGKIVSAVSLTLLIFLPMSVLQRDHVLVGDYVQPRYLLPLMIMLTTTLISRFVKDCQQHVLQQMKLYYVVGLSVAHSMSLHACIRRYIDAYGSGYGEPFFNLDKHIQWWWWSLGPSPMTVWFTGSISFLLFSLFAMNHLDKRPQEQF